MPMYWNEDQQMLADSARPFLADKAPVSHLRALPDGFSRDLWREFADMGFTGLLVGEEDGGLGLGHVEAGVVLEEIGRNLSPSPFLTTSVGAVTALKSGSPAARQAWLPGIVAGETVAALALEEGARHRPHRVATRAERSGRRNGRSGPLRAGCRGSWQARARAAGIISAKGGIGATLRHAGARRA